MIISKSYRFINNHSESYQRPESNYQCLCGVIQIPRRFLMLLVQCRFTATPQKTSRKKGPNFLGTKITTLSFVSQFFCRRFQGHNYWKTQNLPNGNNTPTAESGTIFIIPLITNQTISNQLTAIQRMNFLTFTYCVSATQSFSRYIPTSIILQIMR